MGRHLFRLLALQFALAVVIVGILWVVGEAGHARVAIWGAGTAASGGVAYFAVFRMMGSASSRHPLLTFLLSEGARVTTVIVLLGTGLAGLRPEEAIVFLIAFVAVLMGYLFIWLF